MSVLAPAVARIPREDLQALVDKLQHDHFGYDVAGEHASRALQALEQALRYTAAPVLELRPEVRPS